MAAQKQTLSEQIAHLRPCGEALAWLKTQTGSAQKAWDACPRGDWMLWLISMFATSEPWSDDRKPLLACCLDCAETVRHLWPKEQAKEIKKAIRILREWIGGTVTVEKAMLAQNYLSSAESDADAAAYALDALSAAAYTADADAEYATAASSAADATADTAHTTAARVKNQKQTADIVRQHYPAPPSFAK